jgi:ComF family protein
LSNFIAGILNHRLIIGHSLLSQFCLLCSAASDQPLCAACNAALPRLPSVRCVTCALPVPDGNICGACLAHPPRYDRTTAVFAYAFPVDALIQRFKYGGGLAIAPLLSNSLGCAVAETPDLIIPMPLSPHRLRERGFNQALEIARGVGRMTRIPVVANACRKIIETPPQAALPWKERTKNIRGAFVCDADLGGASVAVIDDVMTSGATLNELARNLRRAGAAHVSAWVVARTLSR